VFQRFGIPALIFRGVLCPLIWTCIVKKIKVKAVGDGFFPEKAVLLKLF